MYMNNKKLHVFLSLLLVLSFIPAPFLTYVTAAPNENEQILFQSFEDQSTGSWESLSWKGNGSMEVSTAQASHGDQSLLFKNRESRESSPSIHITDFLQPGSSYDISLKVRLESGSDTFHLASKIDSPELDNQYPWLIGNHTISSDEWTLLELKNYTVPKDTSEFIIWLEADDDTNTEKPAANIYIDEFTIVEVTSDEDTTLPETGTAKEFTTIDFENAELNHFEPRGENEILTPTNEANHTVNGTYALKIEGRENSWNGPALRVEEFIDPGHEYTISAWVKLDSPDTAQLQLSTQIGSEEYGASYLTLQGKTLNQTDGWVQLEGTYRFDSVGDEYVTIYIESSNNETASFYIDDITFTPTHSDGTNIESHLTPIQDVYKNHFYIGNAVSTNDFVGNRLELLTLHHNLVTAENAMKSSYAYNENREFDFTTEDTFIEMAKNHNLNIHGHVLVWHQQTADWLFRNDDGSFLNRDEALTNLKTHIRTVVQHFGDEVISWDVVNEAMNDNPPNPENWKASLRQSGWYQAIGDDYIEESFKTAKEVLKENNWDHIKLYYNDYNDDNPNKAEAIYQMVKEINKKYAAENNGELLIDGIGMQGHYHLNTNPENVKNSLEKFTSLGVEVGITELDIRAGDHHILSETESNQQAYLYARLFQIYKEYAEHISRVTFWGLDDSSSWRAEENPLLFDGDLQAKPAYYAIIDPDKFIDEYDSEEVESQKATALFGTPTIDGHLDDIWNDAEIISINRYQGAWHGASGEAKVLWDQDSLYVLVEVNDSHLDKSNVDAEHDQDSVEVFMNEQAFTTYQNGVGQYRVNFANETSFNPDTLIEGFESATHVHESGNGYTVEMKIPFQTIKAKNDSNIGFDVQINDAKDGSRQSVAIWNDLTGQGWQDPTVFGHLTLIKPETPNDENSEDGNKQDEPVDTDNTDDTNIPNNNQDGTQTEPKEVVIIKPVIKNNQVTMTDEQIEDSSKNGQLIIDMETHSSSVHLTFTAEQIKVLQENNVCITLKTADLIVEIPASTLPMNNQSVHIHLDQLEAINDAYSSVFNITIVDGKEKLTTIPTPITLHLKIDEDDALQLSNLKIFTLHQDSDQWIEIGGNFINGYLTANSNQLGTFTVFDMDYNQLTNNQPSNKSPNPSTGSKLPNTATHTMNWLVFGAILMGLSILILAKLKRNNN